ncbi:MAG: hypothetical protein ACR2O3_01655 [Rhizobiaceae bacterium]
MKPFQSTLHFAANNSKWVLLLGLAVGILSPSMATVVRPWIGYCIAVLLFLAAFRIKPSEAVGTNRDFKTVVAVISVFQVLLPCLLASVFLMTGTTHPMAIALLLVASSAPISASPSLTMITGNDSKPALRLLTVATAALPFTVLLPFWLMPTFDDPTTIAWIAFKLFLLIFVSSLLAFSARKYFVPELSNEEVKSVDGLTAIMMAVIVIGLMTGFSDAAANEPGSIILTLVLAFVINIGMQVFTWYSLGLFDLPTERAAYSIGVGNRNLAIFLAALPAATTDPILLFIACYQIPMYLTPTLLGRLYRRYQ